MKYQLFNAVLMVSLVLPIFAQSGRKKGYSESEERLISNKVLGASQSLADHLNNDDNDDIIRVETNLITIPVRISGRNGRPISDIEQIELKLFENGVEQNIAYYSNEDQPFTVALVLDMSYSSVFKLAEIRSAALKFVGLLSETDRVMVVSFDEEVHVLCEPTSNRKVMKLAIEGARIASGTSIYSAIDLVLNEKFKNIEGRTAVVLLSDGVDTSSSKVSAADITRQVAENDVLIYPIRYNTFDDVQKSRRGNAEIKFDDNDRPYIIDTPKQKGEREPDYEYAGAFLKEIADRSGGRSYQVKSTTNLDKAFATIANELRKIYSLGYYPSSDRKPGTQYNIKVRVYRPDLMINTRRSYSKNTGVEKP